MGFGYRCQRFPLHIQGYQKVMLLPLWKHHSVLKVPQNCSNSNHAQCDKCQPSAMLFIAWGVEIAQYQFPKQQWKLMTKYLMIFSHHIVQFCEFGFCCSFPPELSVDKVDLFLLLMHPFYLSFLGCFIAALCLSLPASMLSLDSLKNK